mmetsp:Transcript_26234/g.53091  ORF Transcript_26234/g.53091 Transcript_26234/m.53091 type:complete len:240 (+) Transcript_26234:539-1258(+)
MRGVPSTELQPSMKQRKTVNIDRTTLPKSSLWYLARCCALLHARSSSGPSTASQTPVQLEASSWPTVLVSRRPSAKRRNPRNTTAQARTLKPARMPLTISASSLKTLSLSTLTSLVNRAKRNSRMMVKLPRFTRLPSIVMMTSAIATVTMRASKMFQYISGPQKNWATPRTTSWTQISMAKMIEKITSNQVQTSESLANSVLMQMTMAFSMMTTPMKGSRYCIAACSLVCATRACEAAL